MKNCWVLAGVGLQAGKWNWQRDRRPDGLLGGFHVSSSSFQASSRSLLDLLRVFQKIAFYDEEITPLSLFLVHLSLVPKETATIVSPAYAH